MNKDTDNLSLLYESVIQKQMIIEQATQITNAMNPQQKSGVLDILKGLVQGVTGIDVSNVSSIQDVLNKINIGDILNIVSLATKVPMPAQYQISGLLNQLGLGGTLGDLTGLVTNLFGLGNKSGSQTGGTTIPSILQNMGNGGTGKTGFSSPPPIGSILGGKGGVTSPTAGSSYGGGSGLINSIMNSVKSIIGK